MDVGELLTFKPVTAPKRPAPGEDKDEEEYEDDPNDSYEKRAAKRRKRAKAEARRREEERLAALEAEAANIAEFGNPEGVSEDGLSAEQKRKIREMVENADGDAEGGVIDEATMKKLILNFEKRALKNQELRIKFPDEPQKFLESEVELHDAIQELRTLATSPDLYPFLVDLGCVGSFLGLLSHANTDISVAMVDLLQELTDVDTLHESEEGANSLVLALMTNQVIRYESLCLVNRKCFHLF